MILSNARIWFCARYLSAKDTFQLVVLQADPVTVRLMLALGSLAAGFSLMFDCDKFNVPAYAVVAKFGNEHMWTVYFFAHAIGGLWRIFERARSRPRWAVAINLWGFAIWFVSVVGLAWSVGNLGLNTSLALIVVVASGWSLYRTGMRQERVTQ